MTCETEGVRVGDIGTIFEVTLVDDGSIVDVSAATVMQITFKKPSGTTMAKTAVHSTDGTDGKIRYVSIADDIDQGGLGWQLQAYVETPSWQGHSSIGGFEVFTNL